VIDSDRLCVFFNRDLIFVWRGRRGKGAIRQKIPNQAQEPKDQQDCRPDDQDASDE
jgi:hypothetical protein